jgi:hypothetical protein
MWMKDLVYLRFGKYAQVLALGQGRTATELQGTISPSYLQVSTSFDLMACLLVGITLFGLSC